MHIGIDARSLTNWRGFGVYLRALLGEFARQSNHAVTLFVDEGQKTAEWLEGPLPENWRCTTMPRLGRSPFWRDEFSLPQFYRRHPVDVFYHPDNNVCWHGRTPTVVTWHDAMVEMFPHHFFGPSPYRQAKGRLAHWLKLQLVRHHASRIITISESSKRDLCRISGLPESRVAVIANGVHPRFRPNPDRAGLGERLAGLGLRSGYILYSGGLNPHKNVGTLIEAYALLRDQREGPTLPPLVLCGKLHDAENPYIVTAAQSLQQQVKAKGLEDQVTFLGYVPPDRLVDVYNGAAMLAFPSLYEGFGLPPAEAMACGTPVVASRTSSIPEVVGDAALLFDPLDPKGLAESMARVLQEPGLAKRLAVAGPVRAAAFRWETTASETLAVLTAVARQSSLVPQFSDAHQPSL